MIISSAEKLFLEMMMWDVSGRRANGDLSPTGNQWNQLKLKLKSYIIFLKCRHYLTLFLRVLDINVQKLFSQLLSKRAGDVSGRANGDVSHRESVESINGNGGKLPFSSMSIISFALELLLC